MKKRLWLLSLISLSIFSLLVSCTSQNQFNQNNAQKVSNKKTIAVTYAVLGSVVKELVGDKAEVITIIPNGQNMHNWEPSAKDIETLMNADLVVENGLNLEVGLTKAIQQAKANGVKVFTAANHIKLLEANKEAHAHEEGEEAHAHEEGEEAHAHEEGEEAHAHEEGEEAHTHGGVDPHIWTDPQTMKMVAKALSKQLKEDLALDIDQNALTYEKKLDELDKEVQNLVAQIPMQQRKIVSGHISLAYFSHRYGFEQLGAVIPSFTTEAAVSASNLSAIKNMLREHNIKTIFTEIGTPKQVMEALKEETGVQVLEINTHKMPEDNSYETFIKEIASTLVNGLK